MKTLKTILKGSHVKSNIALLVALVIGLVVVALLVVVAIWIPKLMPKDSSLTPADYINRPIKIVVPITYELSVDMGLSVTKYSDMSITCYTNRVVETDSTPHHAASGRIVYEGSCAVSRDIFRKWDEKTKKYVGDAFPGDIVYVVTLDKYYIVEDTMNKRHNRHVDIFTYRRNLQKAREFGCKKSDVYILRLKK